MMNPAGLIYPIIHGFVSVFLRKSLDFPTVANAKRIKLEKIRNNFSRLEKPIDKSKKGTV